MDILDTPVRVASVNLLFLKVTPQEGEFHLQRVRNLHPHATSHHHRNGNLTITFTAPVGLLYKPRGLMESMRAAYGHLKGYDGCEVLFAPEVH